MIRKRQKLSVGILILAIVTALTLPCYAMSQPVSAPVSSMSELLARYHSEDAPDALREYAATNPLVCAGDVTLGSTTGRVDLVAVRGIRVPDGAILTLDNPNLIIMGPPPVITVERGGTLRIQRWHPMMADGSMPTAGMIRMEEGGMLHVAEGLTLPTGMVTVEEDTPPNTLPPVETVPEPEPEPEPELISMEGLYHPIQYLSCGTGSAYVESTLPATVETYLAGGLVREFGVRWDLSTVDCDTPGTYLVYGDFNPESLAGKGASNPKGLRPAVSITLLPSTPIRDLSWRAIGTYVPTLRLAFAALPADVEHLYLSHSADGVNWSRCVRYDTSGNPDGEDFLSAVQTNQATSFLLYQLPKEFGVFYLRLEVDGSVRGGSSNPIRVQSSDFGGALGSGGPNSGAEDGSSEGNRGGGGQGQADRVEQQQPPVESPKLSVGLDVAAPTKDKPESAPDGDAYQPNEITTQVSPDAGATGFTESHVSSWTPSWSGAAVDSGGGGAVSDATEAVSPKDLDTQTEEVGEVSVAEAVESLPESVQTDPTGADESVEIPAEKPLGSADRNGAVLFASFALFGGIAVVGKRGKKRKS